MSQIVMPTYKPSPTAIKFHTSDEFVRGVIAGVGTEIGNDDPRATASWV